MMITASLAWSQAAFVLPSPTNANDSVTIYIDVSKSTSNGLKHMLEAHPEVKDEVYMWTWSPAGPACGNGEWGNSNECMKMTRVIGMIYSMKIVPTSFYNCTPLDLYSKGISCLAKLDNGNAFGSDGVGEAKTEDLRIDILPALCNEKFCYFPEVARKDDFITITYNNNIELNAQLQNIGSDECYVFMTARSGFNTYDVSAPEDVINNPDLKMTPMPNEPGKFQITLIPTDFFPANGSNIQEIWFYIVKPGYLPLPPTYTKYTLLNCE